MMTPAERQAIEQEIDALRAYANAVRDHGPEHFMKKLRHGWQVRDWTGAAALGGTKRQAVKVVEGMARHCADRAGQLRARLTAEALDQEIADTPIEERRASSRAQIAAIDGPRWRKTA
jgi:hypothetical protein